MDPAGRAGSIKRAADSLIRGEPTGPLRRRGPPPLKSAVDGGFAVRSKGKLPRGELTFRVSKRRAVEPSFSALRPRLFAGLGPLGPNPTAGAASTPAGPRAGRRAAAFRGPFP